MTISIKTNMGKTYEVEAGCTLFQLAAMDPRPRPACCALVNGALQELDYPLFFPSEVKWLDHDSAIGWRIYRRSLIFLLRLAAREILPSFQLWVSHSLAEGLFCSFKGYVPTAEEVHAIEQKMREYVKAGLPIWRNRLSRVDAIAFFRAQGDEKKAELLEHSSDESFAFYTAAGLTDFTFGKMALSAACLTYFHLLPHENGFVLRLPVREYLGCQEPDNLLYRQLETTLQEYSDWSELLDVRTVEALNNVVEQGADAFSELALIAETLQERNLHTITDAIAADFPEARLLLLAGPSSSGKTTTAHRLIIQFRTIGIRPLLLSLDDFFLDRDKCPLLPDGTPDFEGLATIDLELFDRTMTDLLAGRETMLPRFDFLSGKSMPDFRRCRLEDNQILIVEGLHALNDQLTEHLPARCKRKIFLSALTELNLDPYTPVAASDNRLMRRIVRDRQFRNSSAEETLERWDNVRKGEHKNIFPFQESADFFLNTSLIYELPVMRPLVEAALLEVPAQSPGYLEASRLLQLIRHFLPASTDMVPNHSILREFVGGSLFKV